VPLTWRPFLPPVGRAERGFEMTFQESFVICPKCGIAFWKDAPWKRLCIDCWKEASWQAQSRPTRESAVDRLQAEVMQLRDEIEPLRSRNAELELERATGCPVMDPTTWRLLMGLCHPDKHGGTQASLTASQWLNTHRPPR
jgi:hypothetical protein